MSVKFDCPACGGALTLRAEGVSESLACQYCGAVLDARDPRHAVLQLYRKKLANKPKIPIGSRGTIRGEQMEVVGWQHRAVQYSGVIYGWDEYLLWNPYKGYRWLVESDGHWIYMKTLQDAPKPVKGLFS